MIFFTGIIGFLSPFKIYLFLCVWILVYRSFCFSTLNTSYHSLLAWRVSSEKSADSLMGFFLQVIFFLSLVAFNTLSLSLIFAILSIICLGVVLPGFLLLGDLCAFMTRVSLSFPRLGEFPTAPYRDFLFLCPSFLLLVPLLSEYCFVWIGDIGLLSFHS